MKKKEQFHLDNFYIRQKKWFINAVVSIPMRLFSKYFRDKKLWVFGCWLGKRYDDNSRYLYEYILKFRKDIKAVWISKDSQIVNTLRLNGHNAVYAYSKEGKKMLRKGGVFFCTNGLDDFSEICPVYGATIVKLEHGACPIKKVGFMLRDEKLGVKTIIKNVLRKIKYGLFFWDYFDYCVVTSKECIRFRMEEFGIFDKKRYIMTGLPRNDVLKHPEFFNVTRPNQLDNSSKNILILLTYRPYENSVLSDLLTDWESDLNFIEILEKNNYKIVIKLHNMDNLSKPFIPKSNNIIVLESSDVSSTQELLLYSDMLITDYSSCAMDFAILNRPLLFYAPDIKEYNKDNGLIKTWRDFYKSDYVIKHGKELKNKVTDIIIGKIKGLDCTKYIEDRCEDRKIRDSIYCDNVINAIDNSIIK